jgi:hypothetical protein
MLQHSGLVGGCGTPSNQLGAVQQKRHGYPGAWRHMPRAPDVAAEHLQQQPIAPREVCEERQLPGVTPIYRMAASTQMGTVAIPGLAPALMALAWLRRCCSSIH